MSKNSANEIRVILLASGDLWAGAEVMVYQLVSSLKRLDHVKILVILLNNDRLANELKAIGVKVHIIDETQLSALGLARGIHKITKEFSPHIIHSHRYKENFLAWLVTKTMRNIQLVATQHGMPEVAKNKQKLPARLRTRIFFRLLSCCFDRTVLVSREMQQSLVDSYGFTEKNTTVIHNGIPLSPNVIQHTNDRIIIGSAGRLFPVKDFSLMVDIANVIVSQNDIVDFVLAGDGPERPMLEEKVRKYDLQGRFIFLGHQDDMDSFYRSLDVYISTSVHEGIPMSVLEAMSHGLPVVVPKVGGFPEIIEDGISGYLIDNRTPDMFADSIFKLLQPQHRRSMASAARSRIENSFSREAMAQQYYHLYRELMHD
ncbi:MAG TPA: glycosyltransferase [Gammaproteobacteria bacterium]|nr:glycosyltransferase [Gammaproteobacteria bacterium]